MSIFENLRIAVRALTSNKLRSLLTMLGIIIGAGAVIALMAIGNGATSSITDRIEGIGANLITVSTQGLQRRGGGGNNASRPPITYAAYEQLRDGLTGIAAIAPAYQATNTQIVQGRDATNLTLIATAPEYFAISAIELDKGRLLTLSDNTLRNKVAVVGPDVETELFNGLNPLGREIKVDGVSFTVIGVTVAKGGGGQGGNVDTYVYIPIETGYARLFGNTATDNGERTVSQILISAESAETVDSVMAQVERTMRRVRQLRPTDDLNFSVFSQNAFLDAFSAINTTLTMFLGMIAGISLFVGGIGVMNIMLVSVTERTREIGLRKAVGAPRRVILVQFLIETILLSLLGGVIGIILGWLIARIVTNMELVTASVSSNSVFLAFGVVALVGVVFGLYPAYRASKLSPIEALRYE